MVKVGQTQISSKFHAFIYCNGCSRPRSAEVGDYIDLNETNETQSPREIVNTLNQDKKEVDVLIYPNPSNGEITINLKEKVNNGRFEIYNLLGNQIKTGELEGEKTEVNLNLEQGFFIIKISNNGKQIVKKIRIL